MTNKSVMTFVLSIKYLSVCLSVCVCNSFYSHGQADVERSLSINGEMKGKYLHPDTLISKIMVYDEILTTSGNAYTYEITPELSARNKSARMKYEQHLEDEKNQKRDKQEGQKRKMVSGKVK